MKTDRQSSHSQCLQRPLVAISASWLKFGQSTPQNTEWSCFNSNNSNIWKIYKKKSWQKKRPRTILKLENVMTGEKCYPTTSFSDMRLWWQKQWLNNMHWQDKLKITKTNKTKNPHLTLSISQGNATNGGSVLMNITGQIDWSSPRSPNTKAARGRRTGNSPLT